MGRGGKGQEGHRVSNGDSMFAAAWHGTPHKFDRFSTEHIGTGEGAQAYGYGLYFAGNKEVAEHYKRKTYQVTPIPQWKLLKIP